jgi:hypothetical protein
MSYSEKAKEAAEVYNRCKSELRGEYHFDYWLKFRKYTGMSISTAWVSITSVICFSLCFTILGAMLITGLPDIMRAYNGN